MKRQLELWNAEEPSAAITALLHCCAARSWAEELAAKRPYTEEDALFLIADSIWATMQEADWMEAFAAHPRIGERQAIHASSQSAAWSRGEQSEAEKARAEVLEQLAADNRRYEELFGFTYIVCATGKSAEELLENLRRRLSSDREAELRESAEQQRQITQIRLRKWLLT